MNPLSKAAPTASGETPALFRKQPKTEKNQAATETIQEKKQEPFSQEALNKAWEEFAEKRKAQHANDAEKPILNRKLRLEEDHQVAFMIGSQLESTILEKFEDELVQFLRSTLENDHIRLIKKIENKQPDQKLYTGQDKYNYMIKQNPALKDLKERLGLDFEF